MNKISTTLLLIGSLVIFACFSCACNESVQKEKRAKTSETEALLYEGNKSATPEQIWDKYHGDTALAVKILAAVYERQWSFYKRKGQLAIQIEALNRNYVECAPIPKYPEKWVLELAGHSWYTRREIGRIITTRNDTFNLAFWKRDLGSTHACGCIYGPGVDSVEVLQKCDRVFTEFLGGIEIICTAYPLHNRRLKKNPINLSIVDADGDSSFLIDGISGGLLSNNNIAVGGDDIESKAINGVKDECWLQYLIRKPYSSRYEVAFWSSETLNAKINPRKCDKVLLTPDKQYRMSIICSEKHTVKEVIHHGECQ
jgi:hypothetical protein